MRFTFLNILLIVLISVASCKGAPTNTPKLTQQTQDFLADFDEFVTTLIDTHPAPFTFGSQEDFQGLAQKLRSEIDNNTTKRDFIWKLSEIIAALGCSHTSLGYFNQQSALVPFKEYFPLQLRWIHDKLYVTDAMINSNTITAGQEITSINGVQVSEIVSISFQHINSQAHIETARKELFNAYATTFIPYVLNFPDSFTVTLKDSENSFLLNPITAKPKFPPRVSPKSLCQDTLCLDELDSETALLTIRSFDYYGERTSIILDFFDRSFQEMQQKNYKNLIIDLRGNMGGSSTATIHLLKHSLQQPFQYFGEEINGNASGELHIPFENNYKDNITVLINGIGNSSVGHLASMYKDRDRAVFVGEDLGSNQFCTANQKQFVLTNTEIKFTVARTIFYTEVSEKDASKIIKPDYELTQSIDDYLADRDVVLALALEKK